MIKFLKKLFGIGEDPKVEVNVELPVSNPVTEVEKTIVVEKKSSKASVPKKEKVVRTTKKREKPVSAAKVEKLPTKKRGRPAKKK